MSASTEPYRFSRPWTASAWGTERAYSHYAPAMPRGYMEGPAAEEAERRAEEAARAKDEPPAPELHAAVYGCTEDDPEPHFLGWLGQVDPDELFATGAAWGVTVRRVAVADAG